MKEEAPPAAPREAAPRLVTWVALLVCVTGAVMVLLGAWRVGVWTDEPAHTIRYANLQEHGWYLLDDDFDGDEPGEWVTDRYVYAPVTTQLMHGVNRLAGLDPSGALGTSVRAYSARHLVVGALGLLGALGVALLGRRLLGSWSWGAVSAATVMAIPMWPGLSMFDIKDIPAATGYTLVTLGLVELLLRPPGRGSRWSPRSLWPVGVLVSGLLLAVGTRPGLWPGLAASIVLALALAWRRGSDARTWLRDVVVPLVAAGAVAYAVLLASYPAYFSRPDRWLLGAVGDSSDYTGSASGDMLGSWYYLPLRVAVLVPPLLLLVGMAGCAFTLGRRAWRSSPTLPGWLLVASQALLLPVLAVFRQSTLYDDLRQVVFAAPAVALLLTLGWRRFTDDLGRGSATVRAVGALAWCAALLVPFAVQLQMFPYGYSYVAPHAERVAVENDWGRLSLRELLPEVPRGEFVVCHPFLSEEGQTMRYMPTTGRSSAELSTDCRTDPLGTLTPYGLVDPDDTEDPERAVVADSFVAVFARGREPGENCRVLGTVERRRHFARVVLSQVARCDLVLNDYPDGGVDLDSDAGQSQYLLGGWTSSPADDGIVMREPFGSLGFTIPDEWAGRSLRLALSGSATEVPEVRVNNEPLVATRDAAGWTLDVPAATVDALGEGRLVITLVQLDDAEPLRLTRVTLVPR